MTTLTIDDATYAEWARRAEASGLTVERWLTEELAPVLDAEPGRRGGRTYEEWKREFDAFLASVRTWNPELDDSRESMYPVRP